jgi:glutamine amidotransferase
MSELVAVDMGISNLGSVLEAFRRIGAPVRVTRDPAEVGRARALVLPGVGAFRDGMAALREAGLVEPIRAHAAEGKPLVGICLGMQLLADAGEEHGETEGLGLVPGRQVRLAPADPELRVPNMGWNDVTWRDGSADSYYFAHSYRLELADPADADGTIEYGGPVVAAVRRGNVRGMQFHPEKSQDAGLEALAAWVAEAA